MIGSETHPEVENYVFHDPGTEYLAICFDPSHNSSTLAQFIYDVPAESNLIAYDIIESRHSTQVRLQLSRSVPGKQEDSYVEYLSPGDYVVRGIGTQSPIVFVMIPELFHFMYLLKETK